MVAQQESAAPLHGGILGVAFLREVLQRQSDGVVAAQSRGATAVRLVLAALEIMMGLP